MHLTVNLRHVKGVFLPNVAHESFRRLIQIAKSEKEPKDVFPPLAMTLHELLGDYSHLASHYFNQFLTEFAITLAALVGDRLFIMVH